MYEALTRIGRTSCPSAFDFRFCSSGFKTTVKSDGPECPSYITPRTRLRSHSGVFRSRSALVITETELKLIAAAARIGLSNNPKKG